jgi:hypothetical protein
MRIARIVLWLLYCAALLAGLDALSRPLLRDKIYHRGHDMFIHRMPSRYYLLRYTPNARRQGMTYGDLSAMLGCVDCRKPRHELFLTDRFGFRNDPKILTRPVRFLLLGDSFAEGLGTTQEKTLARALARETKAGVYDLSLPGSPWQQLVNLQLMLPHLSLQKPTTLVWALFLPNDLDELDVYGPPAAETLKVSTPLEELRVRVSIYWNRSPLRQMLSFALDTRIPTILRGMVISKEYAPGKNLYFYEPYAKNLYPTPQAVRAHRNWPRLKESFEHMRVFSKRHGFEVVVMNVPAKEQVYYWILTGGVKPWEDVPPHGAGEALRALSEEYGFRYVDLLEPLRRRAKELLEKEGAFVWWEDDSHWNDLGQEVAARSIMGKAGE